MKVMNKKRYFKPETEVVIMKMECVLSVLSGTEGKDYNDNPTEVPGIEEGGGDGTDSAPIFFPDLD